VALVCGWFGVPKVTVAGPLSRVQLDVSVPPMGKPSSTTLPCSETVFAGKEIARFGPALTIGGWFGPFEAHVTLAVSVAAPALIVMRSEP